MSTPNTNGSDRFVSRIVETLPQWDVVLLHDSQHSYNYVTTLLAEVFHYTPQLAASTAAALARTGRAVLMCTHKEYAEFKREQVQTFGRDTLMDRSTSSMSAVIEPSAL